MLESDDLDDAHLCIKCNMTILGLEKYMKHRKENCTRNEIKKINESHQSLSTVAGVRSDPTSTEDLPPPTTTGSNSLHHNYETFSFTEQEAPSSYVNKTEHGGKTNKHLSEAYDLTYGLGADVFFSSLQLQSVQSTSGKTGGGSLTRQKLNGIEQVDEPWMHHQQQHASGTETLMKAVRDISESKKHFEGDYKGMKISQIVTDITSDDDDDLEDEVDFDDDDDEDYDPRVDALAMGIKWKLSPIRQSPPTVPVTHTGGKWRPEHRPTLPAAHMARLSPNWDDHNDELDTTEVCAETEHPPAEHTKGKWVPGSKLQRLEYRENVDLTNTKAAQTSKQTFWCNICCRKLKSKAIYEQHLRTSYHLKRAEPEQQLEKAVINHQEPEAKVNLDENLQDFPIASNPLEKASQDASASLKKRKRRANLFKCELCKHSMQRHLIGKHLISHYHYRRMQAFPGRQAETLHTILENIHQIVLQAPYQCLFCCFYANTEEAFLLHWRSSRHQAQVHQERHFWCSYCQYEAVDNDTMYGHLLSPNHKDVILAVNRSVPIPIGKRSIIKCSECRQVFRYNIELRRHFIDTHANTSPTGTGSDSYQSRFLCSYCGEMQRSKIALQRHEKYKHSVAKYHCGVCNLEFSTALKALRHRNTAAHTKVSATRHRRTTNGNSVDGAQIKPKEETVEIKAKPTKTKTPNLKLDQPKPSQYSFAHECMLCNESFLTAQALGRHTRSCKPALSTSTPNKTLNAWQCTQCNFSATYKSDLIYHRLLHTHGRHLGRNELLNCPLCTKSFRKNSMRCHLRHHTNEKIFGCDECPLKFARSSNLKNHISIVHKEDKTKIIKENNNKSSKKEKSELKLPQEKLVCKICHKQLSSKYTLKLHTMNHTQSERRFPCTNEGCKYAASSQHILNIHMASHSNKSFECNHENCSYVGKSKMHLRRHRQMHEKGLKSLTCNQCDFKTNIKNHLDRHKRCHTGEKPHKCPYCEYRCTNSDNLRKHILKTGKHPGKFIYECNLCIEKETAAEQDGRNDFDSIYKSNNFQEYQIHMIQIHKQTINK